MVADNAYYDLLGIDAAATPDEVKKAYRNKDKNPDDPQAHQTFQRIGQAYETLSDPDARAAYDRYGPDGSTRGGRGGGPNMEDIFADMFGGFSGYGDFNAPRGWSESTQFGDDPDFEDGYTNGGFGFGSFDSAGPSKAPKPKRGRDTMVSYEISLEEAFKGKRVVVSLERDRECTHCEGSGGRKGAKKEKCGRCAGKGSVIQDRHLGPGLVGKMKVVCEECDGEGTRFADRAKCKKCKGKKLTKEKKRVEFHIDPGTQDGERIALKGEGDALPGVPPGDVIFTINIKAHPLFRPVHPSNLVISLSISLTESLLGINRLMFVHLDGRGVRIESKRGERIIRHGDEFIIKNEGMPLRGKPGRKGDLRVRFGVDMPSLGWASRTDPSSLTVDMPPPPDDITPTPEVEQMRYLTPVPT